MGRAPFDIGAACVIIVLSDVVDADAGTRWRAHSGVGGASWSRLRGSFFTIHVSRFHASRALVAGELVAALGCPP